jgi:[ribosomal protein S5]-alanine N-acetyltransferase
MERSLPVLSSDRITLRFGRADDAEAAAAYIREHADHLSRYSPERPPEETTPGFWIERFAKDRREFAEDASCRLLLTAASEGRVIGSVNLFSFMRGPFQACILGYGMAEDQQGKGLMTEALGLVITYGFEELSFHRIAANVHPDNTRSRALMQRLAFVEEGLAQEYLLVRGAWVPHVLYARTNPHWVGAEVSEPPTTSL